MRRTMLQILVLFATVLFAALFLASPASADTFRDVPGGGGFGWVGTIGIDDVQACDTVADGRSVRTSYFVNGIQRSVTDTNGSEPGCPIHVDVGTVTLFRVCSTQGGVNLNCTAWETPF